MPVLKQHQNTPAMREAIVLDLGDIGAQAARIRSAAETHAKQIIAEAKAKADELALQQAEQAKEDGYNEGVEQGLAEGREQGRVEALADAAQQLQQLTAAWSQVAGEWEQQRVEMEREARQAVLEFALATAEKLVHRVIEVDESVIVDQAAQALSMVLSAHDASIRIHPVDRPMLEDALPQLLSELATLEHIDLVEDEAITPGGCVVAFGQGRIDATIEVQMQRLVDLILPGAPEPTEDESPDEIDPEADAMRPKIDPIPNAPVYEITEQGLVESGALPSADEGDASGPVVDAVEDLSGDGFGDEPEIKPDGEV